MTAMICVLLPLCTGCPYHCEADPVNFDTDVSAEDLETAGTQCEYVCSLVANETVGPNFTVTDCDLEIEGTDSGDTAGAAAGHLTCTVDRGSDCQYK